MAYIVKTRIPYFNNTRTFWTFDEMQAYLFNAVGLTVTNAPCDGSTMTYHVCGGAVYVTGEREVLNVELSNETLERSPLPKRIIGKPILPRRKR
jgi:hypothetical protein